MHIFTLNFGNDFISTTYIYVIQVHNLMEDLLFQIKISRSTGGVYSNWHNILNTQLSCFIVHFKILTRHFFANVHNVIVYYIAFCKQI